MSNETEMWAVHVQGPDDLHACPTKEVADAFCEMLNRQFDAQSVATGGCFPVMVANVVPWPYGYETWKAESDLFRIQGQK